MIEAEGRLARAALRERSARLEEKKSPTWTVLTVISILVLKLVHFSNLKKSCLSMKTIWTRYYFIKKVAYLEMTTIKGRRMSSRLHYNPRYPETRRQPCQSRSKSPLSDPLLSVPS